MLKSIVRRLYLWLHNEENSFFVYTGPRGISSSFIYFLNIRIHELKSTITKLNGYVYSLDSEINESQSNLRFYIDKIISMSERLNNELDLITEFRFDLNKVMNTDFEPIEVTQVVRKIIEDWAVKEGELAGKIHRVKTITEMPEQYWVRMDGVDLKTILINIIGNALEAVPVTVNSLLKITVFRTEDYVCIQVSDNGVGIPSAKMDKIFMPGYSTKKNGFGLGLAHCKSIVENKYRGLLIVESAVGKGSVFTIKIPIHEKKDNLA